MDQEFLNPQQILNQLELRKDMTAADFGCGSGGWVIPLAKKLEDGEVYAIDILEEPLSALSGKAKLQKISNIQTMIADVEKDSKLSAEFCDLVLMTNLLFQCEDKKSVLAEGKRVLKKGAKLLVIDWKKEAPVGPKEGRISAQEIKNLAGEVGLKPEREFSAGTYHYALMFSK